MKELFVLFVFWFPSSIPGNHENAQFRRWAFSILMMKYSSHHFHSQKIINQKS